MLYLETVEIACGLNMNHHNYTEALAKVVLPVPMDNMADRRKDLHGLGHGNNRNSEILHIQVQIIIV
jgi:hypothetical protein